MWNLNGILVAVGTLTFVHVIISPLSKPNYHSLFLSLASNSSASLHLHTLTLLPHSSSTPADSAAADYVTSVLSSSSSVPSHSTLYDVLLSFPLRRSLSLTTADATTVSFDLVQEPYPGDPYADVAADILPTFHAYAATGSAAAAVVYANYGRVEDFARLRQMGVEVNGTVVVARYGQIFRGDIVRNAEDAGAVAAVLYTDSKDYGGDGGGLFPEGRGMPRSGVQVGSTFRGVGDPTTPGWASAHAGGTCERVGEEVVRRRGLVPGIPSLPVSARDGEVILEAVGGQVADDDWQGGDGGLVYRVGPGPAILNVSYVGNDSIATIRNVIGVIEGEEEPDR